MERSLRHLLEIWLQHLLKMKLLLLLQHLLKMKLLQHHHLLEVEATLSAPRNPHYPRPKRGVGLCCHWKIFTPVRCPAWMATPTGRASSRSGTTWWCVLLISNSLYTFCLMSYLISDLILLLRWSVYPLYNNPSDLLNNGYTDIVLELYIWHCVS